MKITRAFSIFAAFAVLLTVSACDPFDFFYYKINNQSSEDLYITVYSSENAQIFRYGDKLDSLLCQATIKHKSNSRLLETENGVRDVSVFLSMADSCVVQLADSNGAVVRKWYRNYDTNSRKKEFFDTKYWTTSGKNGDCFTFSVSDADLETTAK